MSKKTTSKAQSAQEVESTNIQHAFDSTFFEEPEILDFKEFPLINPQTDLTATGNKSYHGTDQYRYLTTLNGKVILPPSSQKPTLYTNSRFFTDTLQQLVKHESFAGNFDRRIDSHSGEMIVFFKEKENGLHNAVIFRNSLTQLFEPQVALCAYAPKTGAALFRLPLSSWKAPGALDNILEWLKAAQLAAQANNKFPLAIADELAKKTIRVTTLMTSISERIANDRYPISLIQQAQKRALHLAEYYNNDLNALTAYHAFNYELYNCSYKIDIDLIDQRIIQTLKHI